MSQTIYISYQKIEKCLKSGKESDYLETLQYIDEKLKEYKALSGWQKWLKNIEELELLGNKIARVYADFCLQAVNELDISLEKNTPESILPNIKIARKYLEKADSLTGTVRNQQLLTDIFNKEKKVKTYVLVRQLVSERRLFSARKLIRKIIEQFPMAARELKSIDSGIKKSEEYVVRARKMMFAGDKNGAKRNLEQALRINIENEYSDFIPKGHDFDKTRQTAELSFKSFVLSRDIREWEVYCKARDLFRKKEYEECRRIIISVLQKNSLVELQELYKQVQEKFEHSASCIIGLGEEQVQIINTNSVFIGRNTSSFQENQIVLRHPAVSRKHGQIFLKEKNWYYKERRGCAYGTKINGSRVSGTVKLKTGDLFSFWYFDETDPDYLGEEPEIFARIKIFSGNEQGLSFTVQPGEKEFEYLDFSKIIISTGKVKISAKEEALLRIKSLPPGCRSYLTCGQSGIFLKAVDCQNQVSVNNEPLYDERPLRKGDQLKLGKEIILIS
jgi:hypothetical protein